MSPSEHRAEAETISLELAKAVWRRRVHILYRVLADIHLAAASGDYVGEAREDGCSYASEPAR